MQRTIEETAVPFMSKEILIVEDEPLIRRTLAEIFKQRGHKVRTAEDGFSALGAMREVLPDVLVSDLNMPGMSGFELLSVVRRRLPAVFVVATSGAYEGDGVPEGIAADAFHPKATRVQRLVETVERNSTATTPRTHCPTPIWIPLSVDSEIGPAVAMISCPECLRAIPQVVDGDVRSVRRVDCADCRTPVQYAIVPRLDPRTSQPYEN